MVHLPRSSVRSAGFELLDPAAWEADSSEGALTMEVVDEAGKLPDEWERLRGSAQVALSRPFLRAFEAAQAHDISTRYLLLSRERTPVAGAALHRVEIRLDQQRMPWTRELIRHARDAGRPDLLRFRTIMCGLNGSQGRDDFASGDGPPAPGMVLAAADVAERCAAELDLDGVVFGHLHEDRVGAFEVLRERGYVLLPSLHYATVPVAWRSLDEYLARLRADYRRQALAARKDLQAAGIEVCDSLDLGEHAEAFVPLYQAVVEKAEQKIEVQNATFFRELAVQCEGRAFLVGLRKGDRLVAGASVLHEGDRLVCLEVGLDYELRGEVDLYHNLMLSLVERAGQLGVRHLDLGQAAIAAKARLGANIVRSWLLVKFRSPLMAAGVRAERSHLHLEPLPVRRVFKDQPDANGSEVARPASSSETEAAIAASLDAARAGGEWARHVNPDLAALLGVFRADRTYVRGEGVRLWDTDGRELLDFTSGYGALPFGHNPTEVWDAIVGLRVRNAPQMVPGSLSADAGRLAAELVRLAPDGIRYALFANSGAEAVEAAIKAARAATGRPGIVVCAGGFHGKTLGALSATSTPYYQEPFFAPAAGFFTIPYNDLGALEQLLESQRGQIAGFLVEPVLGEGGIVVPSPGYLRGARALCDRYDVLLLVDEVQTGLGRSGRLFACEEEGVSPDAIALSKALGGGLVPAAACLLSERAWSEKLALRHSSTFAGNAMAATAGLAVLQLLTRDGGQLLAEVRRKGDALAARLRDTASRYPVLREVRSRGLMIGLELGNVDDVDSPSLRHLARDHKLVPLLCGYLQCQHGLRVLPPLTRTTTLRLIAPLNVPDEALDRAADAIEDMCARLQAGDARTLSHYLLDGLPVSAPPSIVAPTSPARISALRPIWKPAEPDQVPNGRFVFLVHALQLRDYREIEPSLAHADHKELGAFDRVFRDLTQAVELSHVRLRSATGALAEGWFVGLPFTARGLVSLRPQESRIWLNAAVDLAQRKGADLVGLGAFTSIISSGGVSLRDRGIGLTTGNSYTIGTATQALAVAAQALGIDEQAATYAVIGANGSIGRVCSLLLSRMARRLILVGNPAKDDAGARLEELADEIRALAAPTTPEIVCTVDARRALAEAELVISTTSAVGPILQPEWIRPGAVICDVAQPANVSSAVHELRPDVLVIDGGVVRLPEPVSLGWNFGFETGHSFACMAETITLAFEGHKDHYSLGGRLTPEQVLYITTRAERHGFRVAGIRSFGRPVTREKLKQVNRNAGREHRIASNG